MSLTPKFAAQAIQATGNASSSGGAGGFRTSINTVELYLDYVCPFSAKMWHALSGSGGVLSKVQTDPRYRGKVRFILRQQIQPWHPSSTLVHEAAAAVMQVAPQRYIDASTLLFERQKEFFDVNVVNESRNQTYARLAKVVAQAGGANGGGVDEKRVYDLLHVNDKPGLDGSLNIGNGVTNDIKYMVKTNRMTGVHVTPTVVFNGVVENSISSSFTSEQWLEWLDKNLVEEHL